MSYLIFDTETTGIPNKHCALTDCGQPHIVQLAALLLNEHYEVVQELNTLIKPTNWIINYESELIHGWTTDDCEFMGENIEDALSYFFHMLEDASLIVAHSIEFDLTMIDIECARLQITNQARNTQPFCTMKESINICRIPYKKNKFKYPSLEEAAYCLNGIVLDEEKQHDALYDTIICSEILKHLLHTGIIFNAYNTKINYIYIEYF